MNEQGDPLDLAEEPPSTTTSGQRNVPPRTSNRIKKPKNNERRFFMVNRISNSSSLTVNAVVKSDTHSDIRSAMLNLPRMMI
jgi:hypothetical protein